MQKLIYQSKRCYTGRVAALMPGSRSYVTVEVYVVPGNGDALELEKRVAIQQQIAKFSILVLSACEFC